MIWLFFQNSKMECRRKSRGVFSPPSRLAQLYLAHNSEMSKFITNWRVMVDALPVRPSDGTVAKILERKVVRYDLQWYREINPTYELI